MFDNIARRIRSRSGHSSPNSKSLSQNTPQSAKSANGSHNSPTPLPRNMDGRSKPSTTPKLNLPTSSPRESSMQDSASTQSLVNEGLSPPELESWDGAPTSAAVSPGTPEVSSIYSSIPFPAPRSDRRSATPSHRGATPEAAPASHGAKAALDGDDMSDPDDDDYEKHSLLSERARKEHTGDNAPSLQNTYNVMLSEAGADTPAFRASAEYVDIQFKSLEKWLSNLAELSGAILTELSGAKDSINKFIKLFMPSATHSSILAHDYTTLLFGRYTESESTFWTDLLAIVTRNSHEIQEIVKRLHEKPFAKYLETRKLYVEALKDHDESLAEFTRMPDHSEPAALRDVAFSLYKSRRRLLKISTYLVIAISDLEAEVTVSLLETLGHQFIDVPNRFQTFEPSYLETSLEFHRLKSVASGLRESLPKLRSDMKYSRLQLLKEMKLDQLPRALKDYIELDLPAVNDHPPSKKGWVNVEVESGVWVMLWAYIENGLFGFLGTSTNKTAVIESFRIAVHESRFEILTSEDRRCIFRVWNQEVSLTVQAVGRLDLAQWQAAFKSSIAIFGDALSPNYTGSDRTLDAEGGMPVRELLPWNQSFAIPGLADAVIPGSDAVVGRINDVKVDISDRHWLRYGSTLTSHGTSAMLPTVPAVKPMPTSVTLEAMVANVYFKPTGIPNAITANMWGCLDNHSLEASDSKAKSSELAHYDGQFPHYPKNYPRGLVVQDMDMRSITAQLNPDDKVSFSDFLLFFIRGTIAINGSEAPVRIYVTGEKFIVYSCWFGLVHLKSYDIETILEIEKKHGVNWSELNITLQQPNVDEELIKLKFKLYIDSSSLAKQQLDHVWKNRRCGEPKSCQDLLEPLALLRVEYANEIKDFESRTIGEVMNPPIDGQRTPSESPKSNPLESHQASHRRYNVATWLLRRSLVRSESKGQDILQTGRGMQFKLAEDTLPVSSGALFSVMFGPKSPVFMGHHSGIIESDNEVGPWYRKGKRVERRITQNVNIESGVSSVNKRYSYQKIERQERDIFIVNERLSAWKMPRGDQFYTTLRYVVYNTENGSHLQIWSRVIWQKMYSGAEAEDAIRPLLKVLAQVIVLRVRDAVQNIHSIEDAQKLYGKVRPTKVVVPQPTDKTEVEATPVSMKIIALVVSRSPIALTYRRIKWILINIFYHMFKISSPMVIILLLLAGSVFANYKLFERSNKNYWEVYLENQELNKFSEMMHLSQDPSSMTFTRAIYLRDIEEMISEGTLWSLSESNDSSSQALIPDETTRSRGGCSAKFFDLIRLTQDDFGSLYESEPQIQDTLERVSSLRLDYAVRRNELMTMIRMLNVKEQELLKKEYRHWLASESAMCSRVRPTLQLLNATVFGEIKQYCISCLEEAKSFF